MFKNLCLQLRLQEKRRLNKYVFYAELYPINRFIHIVLVFHFYLAKLSGEVSVLF